MSAIGKTSRHRQRLYGLGVFQRKAVVVNITRACPARWPSVPRRVWWI